MSRPGLEGSDGPAASAGWLSPVVRRLLAEHRLDAADLEGTGRGGRLTRRDVLRQLGTVDEEGGAGPGTGPTPPSGSGASVGGAVVRAGGPAEERFPLSRIRRATAEHLVASLATSAHTLVVMDVDFLRLDGFRRGAMADFRRQEGFGLTYLPFVARAVSDAIAEYPRVNASIDGTDLVVHRDLGLGVAVDLDFEGLIVPVVPGARSLRLRALARRIADLSDRAHRGDLTVDDVSGGTFTITNAGGYGTFLTGPIINQPQVAILSTDGVRMRPVAVPTTGGDWAVAVHPVGNLALSFDHRAYDGAYASAFLARVREILETRDWSAEL